MTKYLIIGDGRVAKHFIRYIQLLQKERIGLIGKINIQYTQWSRNIARQTPKLDLLKLSANADRTLLLIRDDQIENFLNEYPALRTKDTVHFSGAKTVYGISAAHPLMTFTENLYDLITYRSIPFIIDEKENFESLLPELNNPSFKLKSGDKALYHALCVLIGNFTTVLWECTAKAFADRLNLPKSALVPFLKQVSENTLNSLQTNQSALTGPAARGDIQTIIRNLDALNGLPERDLYYAFMNHMIATGRKIGDLPNDYLAI